MTELFYTILNMSISASILILVVLLLRLIFRKVPKWVTVLLWGLVAVRLICPFALETPFSLMPKTEWITEEPTYAEINQYFDSVPLDRISMDSILDSEIGKDITVNYDPTEPQIEIHHGVSPVFVLNCIWLAGVAAMLVYMIVSYICVYRRIRDAKQFRDNIYTSESVSSPFVFGLIRPRICLPENMDAVSMSYVIAHEKAHLRRFDHLWKPFGFILLAVHWFNPLIWLAYILLCRDIEMACDEKVVRDMNEAERADYSEALLECSVSRKMITACPLAFGEVGAKQRIKSVLNYKKPAFWIVVVAVIVCAAAAVCFLTNPITVRNPWVQEYIVGTEGILGQVDKEKYESVSEDFAIGADKYGRAVFKDPFQAFDTMKELYADGLALIAEEQDLSTISQSNYNLYKKFGWQVTSGSQEAQKQASFISGFLDIYENSFTKEKPNTDLPASTVESKADLTLEDVIKLSEKGYDLTWEDFAEFNYIETGSGLYIRVYEIDETFELWIGGGSPTQIGNPMYIRLKCKDCDVYADVTKDDVAAFVTEHQNFLSGTPLAWFYDTAWEKAQQTAEEQGLDLDKNTKTIFYSENGEYVGVEFYDKDGLRHVRIAFFRDENGNYTTEPQTTQKAPVEFTAVIKEFDTAAFENGMMSLNIVEFITHDDTERIAELNLDEQDMITGYYIHDEDESITTLNLPEDTEFIFFDWWDAYTDETDEHYEILGERWISTRDAELFYEYWLPYKDAGAPGYPFVFTASEESVVIKEIPLM